MEIEAKEIKLFVQVLYRDKSHSLKDNSDLVSRGRSQLS